MIYFVLIYFFGFCMFFPVAFVIFKRWNTFWFALFLSFVASLFWFVFLVFVVMRKIRGI